MEEVLKDSMNELILKKKKYEGNEELADDIRFVLGIDDYRLGLDKFGMEQNDDREEVVKTDRHFTSFDKVSVAEMTQHILCLDLLDLKYDKEKLLTDKDYRWSVIEKLYEKPEKPGEYKNWTILRYFRVNKWADYEKLLKTEKYMKIREDYEKQFEKEKQERENKELVPKSVPKSVRKSVRKSVVEVENNGDL
jgi:hypothetical protein